MRLLVAVASFSASSNLFFLLHCTFKNEENAWTIRQFYSPWPPEASKALNLTEILCFTTQTSPQGPKTRAKLSLSTHCSRGAHWASAASKLAFIGASARSALASHPGRPQEAPKRPPGGPQEASQEAPKRPPGGQSINQSINQLTHCSSPH